MKTVFISVIVALTILGGCTYSDFPKTFVGTWTLSNTESSPCLGKSNSVNTPCSNNCQYMVISTDRTYYINTPNSLAIGDAGTYSIIANQITFTSTKNAPLTFQYHLIGDKLVSNPLITPAGC